jgi:ketosteroid isomerase-like protein
MRSFNPATGWFLHAYCLVLGVIATGAALAQGTTPSVSNGRDTQAIKQLISNYAAALDAEPIDMNLLSTVWLNSPEATFIHPLGHEHGWDEIKRNLYENIMEAYFSQRKLTIRDINMHVYGDSAWAEFYWHFIAKSRQGGATVESNGRETQIYRKTDQGRWALVHVHYSGMPAKAEEKPSPAQ